MGGFAASASCAMDWRWVLEWGEGGRGGGWCDVPGAFMRKGEERKREKGRERKGRGERQTLIQH